MEDRTPTIPGRSESARVINWMKRSQPPRGFPFLLGLLCTIQLEGTSASASSIQLIGNSNDSLGSFITLGKTRGTAAGGTAIVSANDRLGELRFAGADGNGTQVPGAYIAAYVDGTPGANDMPGRLVFSTTADGASSPTERMRIDSAGTTTLNSAAATAPFIAKINTSEVARIDSYGRLLVGTSSYRSVGDAFSPANVIFNEGSGTETYQVFVGIHNRADVVGPQLVLGKTRGTTNGSVTIVQSGDILGEIAFAGADGVDLASRAASIRTEVDGTPGADDMPGRLIFSTTADGAASPTERLRIDSSGNVGIGTSSPGTTLHVQGSNTVTSQANVAAKLGANTDSDVLIGSFNGNTPFIASQGAYPLALFTNALERLRITSAGNVGIGTTSPTTPLQVVGTVTATTFVGALTGNASTVTTNANLTGDITSVGNATSIAAGVIVNADISASAGIVDTKLATIATAGKVSNSATTATNANTASAIVARDASGNFTAGDITISDKIIHNGDTNTAIRFPAADTIAFETGGSERVRVDSSGRLLVGNTIARTNIAGATPGVQIEGINDNSRRVTIISSTSENQSGALAFAAQRSGAIGGNTIVGNNANLGAVQFNGSDGANFIPAASIQGETDGTPGTDDMPGRLVFSTTADGAASPTERMRITSAGNVGIGTASPASTLQVAGLTRLNTTDTAATSTTSAIARTTAANNSGNVSFESVANNTEARHHISFVNPNGIVGSISTNASATAYNTSSDYRLKENIVPLTGAIDRLQQIPVHRFNFIADPDTVVDGFIAHEAATVVPECVTGEKDEVDEDGKPIYQGIDQSKIVPLLTAALQEALQKIEDLEARLTAANL